MAKMEVSSSSDLQESVQGQPVSTQKGSVNKNQQQPMRSGLSDSNVKQGDKKVISSTELPSQINSGGKASGNPDDVPKKPTRWWLGIIIVLFVLGAGAAAYFFVLKDMLSA